MSKFIDKLKQFSQGEFQSIGFTAKQPTLPKPRIQLITSLAEDSADSLSGYVAGADAVLLGISKATTGAEALQKTSQAFPDILWGGRLKSVSPSGIKQLTKAGCDFLVFPATDTPLATIESGETGRILEVEASLDGGLLRATNELPVDAVLIAGEEKEVQALTWRHLMVFQRFADLLTKPLLVSAPSRITASELKILWETGISGVIVEVDGKQTGDQVNKLRQEIDKMEFKSLHRQDRAEALLPRTGTEPGRTK